MLRSILKGSKYKKQQTVSKSSDLMFYHSVYFTIDRDASGEDRHEGKVDSRGRHEKKLWYLVPRQSEALDTNLRHFPSRVIQKVQRDGDRGGYDDLQVFNFLNHLGSSPRQHRHVCDKIRSLKFVSVGFTPQLYSPLFFLILIKNIDMVNCSRGVYRGV